MLGQNLIMSLKTMALGVGTVFVALVGLIYVIELINKIINIGDNNKKDHSQKTTDDTETLHKAIVTESDPEVANRDDNEIIAVITAAIAASLNRSTHDIIVKSIRRTPSNSPIWNRASRNEQITGRL